MSEIQAKYYNTRHKLISFCVRQKVLLRILNITLQRLSKKLDYKLTEPFLITAAISKSVYRL